MQSRLVSAVAAEFVGTFALVFFGAGSIIVAGHPDIAAGNLATVALAHGLVLAVFVTATLYVSGGQFNPAVTLGLVLAGKQEARRAGALIASQLIGAGIAALALVLILGRSVALHPSARLGATIGILTEGTATIPASALGVMLLEMIMTFALMLVILAAVADERAHRLGGVCVGGTVAACILAFGPLTGASMNPARTFGPALFGYWQMHAIYWLAPIAGAALAALAYRTFWLRAGPDA